MNLESLNNQYEQFKEEQTYQHLKWLGEKCQEAISYAKTHTEATIEDEFFLTHIFIKPMLNPVGHSLGISFEFLFDDHKEDMYSFEFSTHDTYEHSFQEQIMNAEIANKISEIYSLFDDKDKRELHIMLAKQLSFNLEDIKEKRIIFNIHNEKNSPFEKLLGEKLYIKYEKEKLEQNIQISQNKETKLKL